MMSRFFIEKPIFAWVIAALIILAGFISIRQMPVEQYPSVTQTTITVSATYPSTDAKTLERSVTQVIEQQMKELSGLVSMSSTSSASGIAKVKLTFNNDIDPDIAQAQVQSKIQSVTNALPEAVQRQGITVTKAADDVLMVMAFVSDDGQMSQTDIADFLHTNIIDSISRVEGVGAVNLLGSPYAMRVWLDPQRLHAYALMPSDVITAIKNQNAQVSAGQLAALPTSPDRRVVNATLFVDNNLTIPKQFGEILLKTDPSGASVKLKEVAQVELGSENYGVTSQYNGKDAAGVAIMLAPDANPLKVKAALEQRLNELEPLLPQGIKHTVAYDATSFMQLSIERLTSTLIQAMVLVFLGLFLFLQNWRAALIPTLGVLVVVFGTLTVLYLLGYSINRLTLLAMVLAVGLLIDDAIAVIDNVERLLKTDPSLSILDATKHAMGESERMIVAIALVLLALFVPMVFFGGSVGVIYRQFATTLITSTALSALVAIAFTPALCVGLLKPKKYHHSLGLFGSFNRFFYQMGITYERFLGQVLTKQWAFLGVYALIAVAMTLLFLRLPNAFVSEKDQGAVVTLVQLPAGATLDQTQKVMDKVAAFYQHNETKNTDSVLTIAGSDLMGNAQNIGMVFTKLKDPSLRDDTAPTIAKRAMMMNKTISEASMIIAMPPSPIQGLGNLGAFEMQLQDVAGLGHQALLETKDQLSAMAMQHPAIAGIHTNNQDKAPTLKLSINAEQAGVYGLSLSDINSTIAQAWGGAYVGDFIDRGHIKKIYVQGQANSRVVPEDLGLWYVRNSDGEMVNFASFTSTEWHTSSPNLTRHNGVPSVALSVRTALGHSTAEAITAMETLLSQLPSGIGYEWTGLSLEEKQTHGQFLLFYMLSILVIFLCLAALYKSWSLAIAVMLVIPLGILGAVALALLRGLPSDVYLQMGLLVVIGLSLKNAVLITKFANTLQASDHTLKEATKRATTLRFRPLIITSLAFGIAIMPLFFADGAGADARSVGTSVVGGLLSATPLGLLFIPLFYVWVRTLFPYKPPTKDIL